MTPERAIPKVTRIMGECAPADQRVIMAYLVERYGIPGRPTASAMTPEERTAWERTRKARYRAARPPNVPPVPAGHVVGQDDGTPVGHVPVVASVVPAVPEPATDRKTSEVHRLIRLYESLFETRYHQKPLIHSGKDPLILKRMSKHYGEKIDELLHDFFTSVDPFIAQSGHTIGVFQSVANKLVAAKNGDGMEGLSPRTRGNVRAVADFVEHGGGTRDG